ncbi:MAG: hypothetical protein EXR62_13650 [Chloroflexi bacterium]|nr:hypothetical protein [Chloroflexota bacterium]
MAAQLSIKRQIRLHRYHQVAIQEEWRDTEVRFGGPAMLRLGDGRIVVGARTYTPAQRMSLLWLNTEKGTLTKFMELPSGGDTGYPGLVEWDGRLWVSY